MKRFWSVVLCIAVVFSAFSVEVFSATTYYEAGFDYEKVSGTAKIVNYYGLGGNLVIPETLGGLPVTAIANGAFSCQADTQITSISLPSSLASFSATSIVGNYSLKEIRLAEGNTAFSLVDGVLYNANQTHLLLYPVSDARTSYEILGGTIAIESSAFYGAKNLEKIVFPRSLKTIQNAETNQAGVFENCTALKSVSFPFGLSTIGDYAFMGCSSLTSVFFPDAATKLKIGMGAFLNCLELKSVRLYSNVESIGVEAFGILSFVNLVGMMETKVMDDFYLYAVNNTVGAKYAASAGIGYRELRQTGDFSSNARIFMPKAEFSEKVYLSTSVGNYAESEFSELRARYFAMTNYAKGWRINRRLADGSVLPEKFEESVFYSIPSGVLADFEEEVYLFSVNEATGELTYIPSYIGTAPDAWGSDSVQIEFETDLLGPFLSVVAAVEPGDVNDDGALGVNDVATLAQVLAGWDLSCNYLAADVNGDAAPSVLDVAVLAQVLAGWDTELSSFAEHV